MRLPLALTAALLAGCGAGNAPGTVAYQLTGTDRLFVNAARANTHTFWDLDDAEMALTGQGVCTILARGGTVRDAAKTLSAGKTVRAAQDADYFAGLAAHDYCPQFPTTKPRPYA